MLATRVSLPDSFQEGLVASQARRDGTSHTAPSKVQDLLLEHTYLPAAVVNCSNMDDSDSFDRLAEAPAAAAAAAAAGSTTLDPVETYSFNTGVLQTLCA